MHSTVFNKTEEISAAHLLALICMWVERVQKVSSVFTHEERKHQNHQLNTEYPTETEERNEAILPTVDASWTMFSLSSIISQLFHYYYRVRQ